MTESTDRRANNEANAPVGVLLVGHGTREAAGQAEFRSLAAGVAERLAPTPIEAGSLELAQPDIPKALQTLVERGARRVVVAPVLLFAAGHAQRDIPQAVAETLGGYGPGSWVQAAHLGCHAAIVELSRLRFRQALAAVEDYDPGETLLLVVGRGSRDATANAEACQFARLRWEAEPVGWLEVGFAAMAEPSLERSLSIVAGLPFRRVVVQPHLLFPGELSLRIDATVRQFAALHPERSWSMTEPLGRHELLIDAVCGRISEGMTSVGAAGNWI